MARLTRKNIKVFAGSASNNGVFGSLQAGNATVSNDVETIQSLSEAWSGGWNYATLTGEKLPPLEEFQGVQYVTTYQQAYLMQEGMPEWSATVTYYKGCLAKKVTTTGFQIYNSLTDNNTNHQLSDTSNWKLVMDSDNLYAFDSAVVHIAGSETITGAKTFTSDVTISNDHPNIVLKENDVVKGTNPQTEQVWGVYSKDSSSSTAESTSLSAFVTHLLSDGTVWSGFSAYKNTSGSTDKSSIRVYYPTSGSPYTYAPTPSLGSSASGYGNQIVTVGYLNGASSGVVHTSGNETITGAKTFTAPQPAVFLQSSTAVKGTTPSSTIDEVVAFFDKNGTAQSNKLGQVFCSYTGGTGTGAGSIHVSLGVFKPQSGSTLTENLSIYYPASGNPYATAPASDVANSIVTTLSNTKASKGHFWLGNGMLVNWGKETADDSDVHTVTYDKAFSAAPCVFLSYNRTNDTDYCTVGNTDDYLARSVSTTRFKFKNQNIGSDASVVWFAIGYRNS